MKYVIRGNVHSGKYPSGEMSFGELSVGEMSVRGMIHSGNCLSGNCPSGSCPSGKGLQRTVRRGTVRIPIQDGYFLKLLESGLLKVLYYIMLIAGMAKLGCWFSFIFCFISVLNWSFWQQQPRIEL